MIKKASPYPKIISCALLFLGLKWWASRATHTKQIPRQAARHTPFDEIDTYIEEKMARLNIPGVSMVIVEGDQIVHQRGFGRACPGGAAPTPQTPFFIGSLTKSFTALAVMQLVEAGKVDLDAPVQYYLPWFRVADPLASAQITVRHLLNQTSGLSTWSGWTPMDDFDDRPGSTERQARSLSTQKLKYPVGSKHEYSNTNYNLLGLILEVASGESYADYIQAHIFNPLGMCHSYTDKTEAQQNGLAAGHRYWFWLPFAAPNLKVPHSSLPSGQLISCAEDMGRYLVAQLNEGRCGSAQILSPEGFTEMHRPAAAIETMGWTAHYGMGWYYEEQGQTRVAWHTGLVPDFSAYMGLLPEQKKAVALMVNVGHFMMNPVIAEIGSGVVTRLAGQPPTPSPMKMNISSVAPWAVRALLLIPLLQLLDVFLTTRHLRAWQQNPLRRPGRGRLWGQHILPSLILNTAMAAAPVFLLKNKMIGFLLLFAPDFAWTAILCGWFAGIWAFLRTSLILREVR